MRLHIQADINDIVRSDSREAVDQCIELLRHRLMCDGDVTPFLLKRIPTDKIRGDGPDLGTKHKCRDYNSLVVWARENAWGW